MPEGLLIAGFPRIVSLPLEGKVPRRGGSGTGGMKESGKMHLKSMIYESTLSTADAVPLPQWGRRFLLSGEAATFFP